MEAKGVNIAFGKQQVLSQVDISVPQGEMVALIGPNGSGKTTLLRSLLGLQPVDSGRIKLFGETDFRKASSRLGYVPQRFHLEKGFVLSVREFLSTRLRSTYHWFWKKEPLKDDFSREILEEIGVTPLLDRPMARLSGGQLQRVLIAFSMLGNPELLLLDEPTANVDQPGEMSFYELIGEVHRRHHLTVILVSHDLSMVFKHATWVYALNTRICCSGPPEKILNEESLKQAYGLDVLPYHHHHHHHPHTDSPEKNPAGIDPSI